MFDSNLVRPTVTTVTHKYLLLRTSRVLLEERQAVDKHRRQHGDCEEKTALHGGWCSVRRSEKHITASKQWLTGDAVNLYSFGLSRVTARPPWSYDSKKNEQRLTQTTIDRQCKRGHRINWTDIEGSHGLDKGERTMEVIHSYVDKWLASWTDDDSDDVDDETFLLRPK